MSSKSVFNNSPYFIIQVIITFLIMTSAKANQVTHQEPIDRQPSTICENVEHTKVQNQINKLINHNDLRLSAFYKMALRTTTTIIENDQLLPTNSNSVFVKSCTLNSNDLVKLQIVVEYLSTQVNLVSSIPLVSQQNESPQYKDGSIILGLMAMYKTLEELVRSDLQQSSQQIPNNAKAELINKVLKDIIMTESLFRIYLEKYLKTVLI